MNVSKWNVHLSGRACRGQTGRIPLEPELQAAELCQEQHVYASAKASSSGCMQPYRWLGIHADFLPWVW